MMQKAVSKFPPASFVFFCLAFFGLQMARCTLFTNDNQCGTAILKELNLPEKQKRIVLYVLDCGATRSASINVHILEEGQKLPKGIGNVFSEWDSKRGKPDIHLESEEVLTIIHFCQGNDVYRAETKYAGIQIRYQMD